MKRLALILVVLATAGVPAYLWVVGSLMGVSSKHPLGELAVIDAWLADKAFAKVEKAIDEQTRREFGAELDGARLLVYTHVHEDRTDVSVVAVALDAQGGVKGVSATFWSGAEEMGAPRSRGEAFAGTLWIETAGQRPAFVDGQRGRGRFAQQVRVASFDRNRVEGEWVKTYTAGIDLRGITDRVTLHVD